MSDGQRFYISQTCGYRTISGGVWEHEYAVVDQELGVTVALFFCRRGRKETDASYSEKKRETHLRARVHCHDLNLAAPAPDVEATVTGETIEGLVLDDLPRMRRGNYLPATDVHDDVTLPT